MAVSVTGSVSLLLNIIDQRTAITGSANEAGSRAFSVTGQWAVQPGTAAGLADKVWSNTSVLTSTSTDSIDLAGTLTDSFGAVVTFVKVRAIAIVAAAANTTTLTIARIATAGTPIFAADGDALAPLSAGGFFCYCDPAVGFTVAATTDDILSVTNSAGASATYTIAVLGTSV